MNIFWWFFPPKSISNRWNNIVKCYTVTDLTTNDTTLFWERCRKCTQAYMLVFYMLPIRVIILRIWLMNIERSCQISYIWHFDCCSSRGLTLHSNQCKPNECSRKYTSPWVCTCATVPHSIHSFSNKVKQSQVQITLHGTSMVLRASHGMNLSSIVHSNVIN